MKLSCIHEVWRWSDNYCWHRSDRVILVCCCYLRLDYDIVLSFVGKNNHGTVWIFLLYKPLILLSIYNVKVSHLSPFLRLFAWITRVTSAALAHWHETHLSGLQDFLLHIVCLFCLILLYTGSIFRGKFKYPSVLPYGPVTKYNIKITLPIS